MHIESILEVAYAITGLLMAPFLLVVAYLISKKAVIGRIFLKHSQFKNAVYILAIGTAAFFIGNILNWSLDTEMYHDIGEITLNLAIIVFASTLIHISQYYFWPVRGLNEVRK